MSSPRITYSSHTATTPEAEVSALSVVYKFVLNCHAKRNADEPAPEPVGRDGTTVKGDSANVLIIQK
jgi:hypothetical protein